MVANLPESEYHCNIEYEYAQDIYVKSSNPVIQKHGVMVLIYCIHGNIEEYNIYHC